MHLAFAPENQSPVIISYYTCQQLPSDRIYESKEKGLVSTGSWTTVAWPYSRQSSLIRIPLIHAYIFNIGFSQFNARNFQFISIQLPTYLLFSFDLCEMAMSGRSGCGSHIPQLVIRSLLYMTAIVTPGFMYNRCSCQIRISNLANNECVLLSKLHANKPHIIVIGGSRLLIR